MLNSWDQRFLKLANEVATWSKDPEVKVGAVLVSPDRYTIVPGFNGFPRGLEDKKEWLQHKETKNSFMLHAEVNAVLNAGTRPVGWTLYCTRHPCVDCAKHIAQAGVTTVVCPEAPKGSSWTNSCELGRRLLDASQIACITF